MVEAQVPLIIMEVVVVKGTFIKYLNLRSERALNLTFLPPNIPLCDRFCKRWGFDCNHIILQEKSKKENHIWTRKSTFSFYIFSLIKHSKLLLLPFKLHFQEGRELQVLTAHSCSSEEANGEDTTVVNATKET